LIVCNDLKGWIAELYNCLASPVQRLEPIENADRLEVAIICDTQVVVGKGTFVVGQTVLFFPTDGQLSAEYAKANDLIARVDEQGNRAGGYFEENRRVRAQNFRGVRSYGYAAPIESVAFTGINLDVLTPGTSFTELNNVPICNKYVTAATRRAIAARTGKVQRGETNMFKKHYDTPQLKHTLSSVPPSREVILTEKIHGTSQRTGYVLDEVEYPLNFVSRIKNIGRNLRDFVTRTKSNPPTRKEWTYLNGTRNVIINDRTEGQGFYGDSEGFRQEVAANFQHKLRKGETVFYEIVGFAAPGKPIMGRVGTEKLKDKAISKQYGKEMTYTYGCRDNGTGKLFDVYVYRITMTNEDGDSIDLAWDEVKHRCQELNVKAVPELARFWYDGDKEQLLANIEPFVDGPSTLDNTHIREGVCVRVGNNVYKHKSFPFLVLEGVAKEKDDYVDAEEIA
jgi:RNA ligase (TIGR02306 family)